MKNFKESLLELTERQVAGVFSAVAGMLGSYLYENTGIALALHEVVGHGMLGMRLTSDYPQGTGPTYWVAGYEEFKAIGSADSPAAKIKAFFSWLFIHPQTDNGLRGWAKRGEDYHPNALAHHMGVEGTSAWISITGPLSNLAVNAICVGIGMKLRKKYPKLAIGLIFFGLFNTLTQIEYAWNGVEKIFSPNSATKTVHDFINFANRMGNILGFQASTIAFSTALFFTGFVPLLAICMYLSEKSPKAPLGQEKALQELSKLEKTLDYAATTSVAVGAATQLTSLLSITLIPTLTPAAIILKTMHPVLGLLSIAQGAYETYKDLNSPSSQIPLLAKILSCLKLAVTIIMATSMLVATFVPGMQLLFVPATLINSLFSVLLSYVKDRVSQPPSVNKSNLYFFSPCNTKQLSQIIVDKPSLQESCNPQKKWI